MQALITRRPARLIVALLAVLILAFGLAGSPAQAAVDCKINGPTVTEGASEAGGMLISFDVDCKGNETVDEIVAVTVDGVLLFKATVVKTVTGHLFDKEQIHLPPLPTVKVPQVCVTAAKTTVCVPPSL